jgi:hypothetical protein
MSLQPISKILQINDDNLPFLNQYLEGKDLGKMDGQTFLVDSVLTVKSGKGYILTTQFFSIFIWKNSRTTDYLLTSLLTKVEDEQPLGIAIQINPRAKDNYALCLDFEEGYYWANDIFAIRAIGTQIGKAGDSSPYTLYHPTDPSNSRKEKTPEKSHRGSGRKDSFSQ